MTDKKQDPAAKAAESVFGAISLEVINERDTAHVIRDAYAPREAALRELLAAAKETQKAAISYTYGAERLDALGAAIAKAEEALKT